MSRQSKALACGHAVCLIRIRNFLLDASLPRGLASLERVVCGTPLIEKDFVLTKFGEPLCSSNVLRVMASYGVLEILPNLGSATGASRVAVCSCARLALARHVKYIVGQCPERVSAREAGATRQCNEDMAANVCSLAAEFCSSRGLMQKPCMKFGHTGLFESSGRSPVTICQVPSAGSVHDSFAPVQALRVPGLLLGKLGWPFCHM